MRFTAVSRKKNVRFLVCTPDEHLKKDMEDPVKGNVIKVHEGKAHELIFGTRPKKSKFFPDWTNGFQYQGTKLWLLP